MLIGGEDLHLAVSCRLCLPVIWSCVSPKYSIFSTRGTLVGAVHRSSTLRLGYDSPYAEPANEVATLVKQKRNLTSFLKRSRVTLEYKRKMPYALEFHPTSQIHGGISSVRLISSVTF